MDNLGISNISMDKAYLKKERNQGYMDWTIAFWRELFQNSVDAGAKNIAIDLADQPARGTFAEPGVGDKVITNVVFEDDGHGMDADTINDVYFKMGKSSKDADDAKSIGGFGRARIMTCFSQERYTILTTNCFVMGDGIRKTNHTLTDAIRLLSASAENLEKTAASDVGAYVSLEGLRADIALLRTASKRKSGFKGCRVEVDLDRENLNHTWSDKPGTLKNMRESLHAYLGESQLPCAITINGMTAEAYFSHRDGTLQSRKGPVRKTLYASDEEGNPKAFATIHTSEGKKALFKGELIVRVSGASMYRTRIDGVGAQIIVEVDPTMSRKVLNSNRDGMKSQFNRIISDFTAELVRDTLTALRAKEQTVDEIVGEKGLIISERVDTAGIAREPLTEEVAEEVARRLTSVAKVASVETMAKAGINQSAVKSLLDATYNGQGFLRDYVESHRNDDSDLTSELTFLERSAYETPKSVEWFVTNASPKAKAWVMAALEVKLERKWKALDEAIDTRLKGMHDIYVNVESANEKTRAYSRKNHPTKWDVGTGSGRYMRSLLAVWTAGCAARLKVLYRIRPDMRSLSWTTGFVYSLPQETHQGDSTRHISISAQCVQKSEQDFRLLINPITDDAKPRYDLTDIADLRRILSKCDHEVAHMLEIRHNEALANIITDLGGEGDPEEAFADMRAAFAAVTAAYAEGKARVQPLDNHGGVRPAERRLRLASANDASAAAAAMELQEDGTYSVDTRALHDRVTAETDENTHAPDFGSGF
jgi:hypothetical protein